MKTISRREFPDPVRDHAGGGGAPRHARGAQRGSVRQGRRQQGVRPHGAGIQGHEVKAIIETQ